MVTPVSLTIYNHKGGVGKTTLTVNVAAALAAMGKRVLIIDSDPQCNLTSYLLADEVVDNLLNTSDSLSGATIWTAVKPVLNGTGPLITVNPVETGIENVFLLPGDIRLSEYEQFLGDAWTDCLKRRVGALRATCAISLLAGLIAARYSVDYVFYDTGPNIGPLNRVLLLGSSGFIVPVACDLFSMRALSTLGQTLKGWIIDWQTIAQLAPKDEYLLPGRPRFIGFIPQRFRVYGQRMARSPSQYLRTIEKRMRTDVIDALASIDTQLAPTNVSEARLGSVQEYGSLVQEAQREGIPLACVEGVNDDHRENAEESFAAIAESILRILESTE